MCLGVFECVFRCVGVSGVCMSVAGYVISLDYDVDVCYFIIICIN